ncbi:MAG TPA: hypothetical protein VFK32_09520 [Tepidiformaceae bacterium]|nr:hypothetical protein [Tepidiformaceae bacterium]
MGDDGLHQGDHYQWWTREMFALRRSVRYHARRQAFFELWHNTTSAASILLGAGTVGALTHPNLPLAQALSVLFPLLITLLSTFNLVWGSGRRARVHNDLYRQYVELEREMAATTDPDERACRSFGARRLVIEADEPPTMLIVKVLSHNEVVRANGAGDCFEVPFWQRWLAHVCAFPNATFVAGTSALSKSAATR